ncbi:MAG: single-stranded DNA-binding protein [Bryobacterales bacterium]|nr:single-stranded DNA-binding protein [Bryobacterales bacterium]
MARSVNKVIVLGHLGKDAETRFTQSGVAVTKLSVATSRRWKDGQSDEWKEETDWHNIVVWRQENLANYLTKGKQVYLEGRLQTRSFEDREGSRRYITEIVADEVILLGGQQGGSQNQHGSAKGSNGLVSQPRGRAEASGPAPADDFGTGGIADDDVPF